MIMAKTKKMAIKIIIMLFVLVVLAYALIEFHVLNDYFAERASIKLSMALYLQEYYTNNNELPTLELFASKYDHILSHKMKRSRISYFYCQQGFYSDDDTVWHLIIIDGIAKRKTMLNVVDGVSITNKINSWENVASQYMINSPGSDITHWSNPPLSTESEGKKHAEGEQ